MVFFYTLGEKATKRGFKVYMGRDKWENEELLQHGWPEDVWFHVDNLSSAHVYLRMPNDGCTWDNLPPAVINQCCQIVKNNSIEEVIVLDKGHGYNPDKPPKITVVGGKGNGGHCESIVDDDGYLSLIKVIHPGNYYTETPNIIIESPLMNSNCHFCCKGHHFLLLCWHILSQIAHPLCHFLATSIQLQVQFLLLE